MPSTTIKLGTRLQRRRTGVIREVRGFTTKPSPSKPSDGVRRARLVDPWGYNPETRIIADQILKTYQTV